MDFSRRDIAELYELREALEVYAVGKAAAHKLSPTELETLEAVVKDVLVLRDELAGSQERQLNADGMRRFIRIDWAPMDPTAMVIDQGGVARDMRSRTERDPRLLGSKHRAAEEREVTVVRGASDGRTVVLVPEAKGLQITGMTLLHVRFADRLPAERAAAVLSGYRTRFNALSDAVTETEPVFDRERLGQEPITDLLTEPVYELARRWRARRS